MARRDLGVDVLAVVGTVAGEGPHWSIDPVEQGTDLGAVVGIPVGQDRGNDLAGVGVRGEVQYLPGPTPLGAVVASPGTRAASPPATRPGRRGVDRCCPPAGARARSPPSAAAPPAS